MLKYGAQASLIIMDRYARRGWVPMEYDANGNLTRDQHGRTLQWDAEMLAVMRVPRAALPRIVSSVENDPLGMTRRAYEGALSTLCAGCGHDSITAAIVEASWRLAIEPQNLVNRHRRGAEHDRDVETLDAALHEPARGVREERDRVHVHERLEHARQGLGVDEDVGEEREREDRHEPGVHDRVWRAHEEAERREHPREREREADRADALHQPGIGLPHRQDCRLPHYP